MSHLRDAVSPASSPAGKIGSLGRTHQRPQRNREDVCHPPPLAQICVRSCSYRNRWTRRADPKTTGNNTMANLAATLKEEVQRLARKEIKAQTGTTKQAVAQYRREIAKLKRQFGCDAPHIDCGWQALWSSYRTMAETACFTGRQTNDIRRR